MVRNRKRAVIAWTVLGTYLVLTLLPAGALVHCISEPGHSAIEFTHAVCSEIAGVDHSARQDRTFCEPRSGCTDNQIAFSTPHVRIEPIGALSLQPTAPMAIPPNVRKLQLHCASALRLSACSTEAHHPTDHLSTVVLLI